VYSKRKAREESEEVLPFRKFSAGAQEHDNSIGPLQIGVVRLADNEFIREHNLA